MFRLKHFFHFFCLFIIISSFSFGELYLKENLKRAVSGDYVVTCQNKTYTVMHIFAKSPHTMTIEEISVPSHCLDQKPFPWKEWMQRGAPQNTLWVRYLINTDTGNMQNYYSFTQQSWMDMSKANSFLTTLLNLRLSHVPYKERKRLGNRPPADSQDWQALWQPKMTLEGQVIPNVPFEAWKTYWPRDNTELGGKEILVYTPAESNKYPSYFPYWLQVSGLIEKAKIRIIDSGRGLQSPRPALQGQ